MKKHYIIGMDIGGTSTDAVLVDEENKVISFIKTNTTEDISIGFSIALELLLKKVQILPEEIQGIFLGTTEATNALLQNKNLFRVGVLRLAGQKPETLPPGFAWPKELKETMIGAVETIHGGFECHGGVLTPISEKEVKEATKRLLSQHVESLAIIGVFSPLNGAQEKAVAEEIQTITNIPISLSSEIGGIGFIERENSTILNASLKQVMKKGFSSLKEAALRLSIKAPLMITQNDGSLMTLERAIDYPVLTISAGPTNSFIGAARLAGLEEAIVVDIGGTSTDVGLIRKGFPVRSFNQTNIGGVLLNFSIPDVLSIGLGGGSTISFKEDKPQIGPLSVAKHLFKKAKSFGGEELTLTDVALSCGYIAIKEADPSKVCLRIDEREAVFKAVKQKLDQLIQSLEQKGEPLPILFVGGGASLLPPSYFENSYQLPSNFTVANAYGAALSEISGTVDMALSLENRENALKQLHNIARQDAIKQGADPNTLRLIDQQIIPYSYLPNQMARVFIRYFGKVEKKGRSP